MGPTLVEQMKKATHAEMLLQLRLAKEAHPQPDAPTKAVYVQAYYDPDNAETPLHVGQFYNIVPPQLAALDAKDQLLDTGFADEYPDGKQPPKMRQSSPTIHSETLGQMTHSPELEAARKDGAPLYKIGYINQIPCPRCMTSLALGGVDVLVVDRGAFDAEWMTRRYKYGEDSLDVADQAGIRVIELDPETLEMSIWTEGKQKKPYTNGFYVASPTDLNGGSLQEHMDKLQQTAPVLNPYTDYMAAAQVDGDANIYFGEPVLSPGIDSREYTAQLREKETKYSLVIPPVTALLIRLHERGINPESVTIHTNQIPAMRDIINAVAAGVKKVHIAIPAAIIEQLATHQINGRRREHDSTHPEAGEQKAHMIYSQLSALKLLQRELGDALILEPLKSVTAPNPSGGSSGHDGEAATYIPEM